jgi:hypothetical protein
MKMEMKRMKENKDFVDENFAWFSDNKLELIKEYDLKNEDVIIIADKKFVAKFGSYEEASAYTWENLKDVPFIIQKISDLDPKMNNFGYVGLNFYA